MKKGLKIIGYILGILILIRLGYSLLFPVYQVATDSMEPTISKGDYVMVSKLHYKFFNPNKNDVVLFKPIDGLFNVGPWVHRIIAVNGDTVSIQNGIVMVNGENALFPEINHDDLKIKIEKSYVFQKGDNKKTITGVVAEDEIIGKVIFNFSK